MTMVHLIGAARSGTKFLRDVIADDLRVAAVPYDVNFVWRTGQERHPNDALSAGALRARQRTSIARELRHLAEKHAGVHADIVIEKTVANSLRLPLLREIDPGAKFLYLERDGLDVVESAYRQWTAPNDTRYLREKLAFFSARHWRYALWFTANAARPKPAIWGPRYPGIEDDLDREPVAVVCARQWAASVRSWHNREPAVGLELEVAYAELFTDPEGSGARIGEFLGIDGAELAARLTARAHPVFEGFPGSIPERDRERVREIVAEALADRT